MRIFYFMGKSAAGKDTIYENIKKLMPYLKTVILYTTRPMRQGEENGKEYYFVSETDLKKAKEKGQIVESRTYQTTAGPWTYYTLDDGQIDKESYNGYLMIGTLQSYMDIRSFYGSDQVIPIYISANDGIRLERAIAREQLQKNPDYKEVCRRFLADSNDFSEENLEKAGIAKQYDNIDLRKCLSLIREDIEDLQTNIRP